MVLCVYQPVLRKKVFRNNMDRTSMKPQPDLLTKAGRKALGNGMKENWTPLKQHYRLARTWQTMLYLFLYFIIIIFFMSIVSFFSPLSTDNVETSEFSWQRVEVPQGWGRWRKCWWTTKRPTGSPADAGLRSLDLQDLPPHCPPHHPPCPHPSYAPTDKKKRDG